MAIRNMRKHSLFEIKINNNNNNIIKNESIISTALYLLF